MSNRSKIYGYYGGVTNENHYVPPPSTPFVPQPASVPFYKNYTNDISNLLSSVIDTQNFLSANDDILLHRHLVAKTDTEEFYEINTKRDSNDLIVYSTGISGVSAIEDITVMDGGTF